MAPEKINSSIFSGEPVKGKAEDLFGKLGEITRSGKYYSMNLGQGTNGYHLVVLDSEKSELTGYIFDDDVHYLQRSMEEWSVTKFSFDPKEIKPGGISDESLFSMADRFIGEMKRILPEFDENDQVNITVALRRSINPMVNYYAEEAAHIRFLLNRLTRI